MAYYRELTKFDLGALTQRVYAGAVLEAGNVYGDTDPVTWRSLRYGGAVFVGAETLIGPLYLGWGWTEPDRRRFYLIVGERF